MNFTRTVGVICEVMLVSNMIKCDKCHKMMYSDSRSERGSFCEMQINYTDGLSVFHLCKACHRQLLTEFMRDMKPEDYDDDYGTM